MNGTIIRVLALLCVALATGCATPNVSQSADQPNRSDPSGIRSGEPTVALEKMVQLYVAPNGTPEGRGAEDSPLDLLTAFTDGARVKPGTLVWLAGGAYTIEDLVQSPAVHGEAQAPVVYRARKGERATIKGRVTLTGDHTWLWGIEVTGSPGNGIAIPSGDGVKLINMVIHANGVGQWRRGVTGGGVDTYGPCDGHEYYGNLVNGNGRGRSGPGIRLFNTAAKGTNRIADNIVFGNGGVGIYCFGRAPLTRGYEVEGNICFAGCQDDRSQRGTIGGANIFISAAAAFDRLIFRANCAYHAGATSQQSNQFIDMGHLAKGPREVLIADNYVTHSLPALSLRGLSQATVRNNTLVSPERVFQLQYAEGADRKKVVLEGNTYVSSAFDLDALRKETGSAQTDKVVPMKDGRPTGTHVMVRVNQYEPERVHIAVFNWDQRDAVDVDLKGVLAAGDTYRVVSALDFFGAPVIEGKAEGSTLRLPMKGHTYEPEFGAFVLFRTPTK
jgi:hypothetical protein